MGWYLLRKPYPGLTEEQKITIDKDVIILGRGKDCTVHCLSMYVSRRHLKVIPKLEDSCICLTDLNSSNGTFVNQTKITSGVEFPLNVGDEIGVGNITVDTKDCFVYELRRTEDERTDELRVQEQPAEQPTALSKEETGDTSAVDLSVPHGSVPRPTLERGLKRFALEPEIVTIVDDEEEEKEEEDLFVVEASSGPPKRLRIEENSGSPFESKLESITSMPLTNAEIQNTHGHMAETSSKPSSLEKNVEASAVNSEHKGGHHDIEYSPSEKLEEIKTRNQCSPLAEVDLSDVNLSGPMQMTMHPPPPPTESTNQNSNWFKSEESFSKPKNLRLSSLLEDNSDTSAGTIKLSSPVPCEKALSPALKCSTPFKQVNPLNATPVLTSTPCTVKAEAIVPCTSKTNTDWSPIAKNSSRHSQESSANYTLDEEMIPIDLSDEDDEIFPCSQLFAEEDVKPSLQDLDKENNFDGVPYDEELETREGEERNDLDDVILISSAEEDEEEIEDANRWFMRLSQSAIKSEPVEEDIKVQVYAKDIENIAKEEDLQVDNNLSCELGYTDFDLEQPEGNQVDKAIILNQDSEAYGISNKEKDKDLDGRKYKKKRKKDEVKVKKEKRDREKERRNERKERRTEMDKRNEGKYTGRAKKISSTAMTPRQVSDSDCEAHKSSRFSKSSSKGKDHHSHHLQKYRETSSESDERHLDKLYRKKGKSSIKSTAEEDKTRKSTKSHNQVTDSDGEASSSTLFKKGESKKDLHHFHAEKSRETSCESDVEIFLGRQMEESQQKKGESSQNRSSESKKEHNKNFSSSCYLVSDSDRDVPSCSHHHKSGSKKKDHHHHKMSIVASSESDSENLGEIQHESYEKRAKSIKYSSEEDEEAIRSVVANDSEFEKLLRSSHTTEYSKTQKKQALVCLERLEDDPKIREIYRLPLPDSPCTISPPPPEKKKTRKIELVDALPNPPRRASNRGISSVTALKMFEGDKPQNSGVSRVSKPTQSQDKKTLRKEKLAQVAAQNISKDKGNSETKRAAPAKIKITKSNRGSFFLDSDDCSPLNKPKNRQDIIRNIKIPKLKDKVVNNLPAKSPLQDMNMSWEKDQPEPERPPPSPEPVEIPTGPQPKKRVAQVPPPGFYRDLDTVPQGRTLDPLPPAPNKSCLFGSSKHNIALNATKPTSAKKSVRFKEDLVQIKYIEKLPNTKSVCSFRDADRPKTGVQVQVSAVALPLNRMMPNDEAILQDVIYDISKWNPLWLKEEKGLPPDVLPPVVSNMNLPSIPKTEFLDFNEYHDTMYPLLMLDLWTSVSKDYNSLSNENRKNMLMAVDSASSSLVFGRSDRMLTTLNCHMLVDERKDNDPIRLGTLVVIDLALKDPSGKLVVNPVFGYVSFDAKDRLRQCDQFHKDLVSHCRNPAFKIRFSLLIRERKNCTFVLEKPMRVKNVTYVRGDLRVFQAMKNLEYMPLQYSILSPSAANEDFTLPDISMKRLAFAEQLNSIQERVVLQTAEVCQQEKPKICLIQGPPGTGKSHVIASLALQLLYRDGNYTKCNREKGLVPRILICAPSNNAVDLLVRRLLRKRKVLEKQLRFKMVRVGTPQQPDVVGVSLQELAKQDVMKRDQSTNGSENIDIERNNLNSKLHGLEMLLADFESKRKQIPQDLLFRHADTKRKLRVLEDRRKQHSHAVPNTPKYNFAVEREAMKKILRGADIVATTLNSCMVQVMQSVFPPTSPGKYHFQVCIVDEATQCMEVETLIPLLLGVKTLILVGDPNQLPATILSKVAQEKGLGTSLFARLQKIIPNAVQFLDTQYRMHPEILQWPNKFFYNRQLKTQEILKSCRDSKVLPYAVLSLPFQQDQRGYQYMFSAFVEVNCEEAKLVLQLAEVIIEKKAIPQKDFRIGIVTPYQSQRRTISSMLQSRKFRDSVEVNTIDSCQGQEKEVIIISCVRTNGVGFLSDRQRLNVALTRAKYAQFICGNFSSLDRDPMWNNLLNDARQRKIFIEIRGGLPSEDLWNCICKR